MGVERFANGIAGQPRKANKPVMPSPCGASRDRAILTGSIDQQKFHKAIYRHLYCDIGTEHGQCRGAAAYSSARQISEKTPNTIAPANA